jgi:ATP-dependent 26S proteasome regulatory subunit
VSNVPSGGPPPQQPQQHRPQSPVEAELETLIRARYPIIYIVSWEERRVEETLRDICQRRGKKIVTWTITTGLNGNTAAREPVTALDQVLGSPDQSVFVLKDFHPFITDVAVTRRLRDLVYALKTSYKTLIILSPLLKLPPELEKEITVVDYQLPTVNDLDRLLEGIIQSVRARPEIKTNLTPLEREQILKAASGLTSNEAENVFAKSLVEKRGFDIDVILGEKEQIIRKSGILEYYRVTEAFADVGGMDLLKQWMSQRTASFNEEARRYGLPEPRGVLLLGVQGCGKSLIAKSIASLWRLPLLRLDVGKIFAGIVGSSEENMRKAIATAESVAPCVAGDTRITLADGSERTIQEMYDGSETDLTVLGMDEQFQIVPVGVRAVTRRAAPDLFTVRVLHTTLQATSNHLHPVLREGTLEWVRTDALQVGDHIALPRRIPTPAEAPRIVDLLPPDTRLYAPGALGYARADVRSPQRRYAARVRGADFVRLSELQDPRDHPPVASVTKWARGRGGTAQSLLHRVPPALTGDLAYLMGLVDSDGFLGKNGRIGFVNTDVELQRIFVSLLESLFAESASTIENDIDPDRVRLPGVGVGSAYRPCYTSYADNRLLARLLTALRERLLSLPEHLLVAYIRGYFDGDGFISDSAKGADPKIALTAKKRKQNQLVRSVLHRIGFVTTSPGSANVEITGWANVRRFVAQIGSLHPMRASRMRAWASVLEPEETKDRTDAIPVGARLGASRRETGMGSQHFRAAGSSLIHRYEHGIGHPNRDRLRDVVADMRSWAADQGRVPGEHLEALTALVDSPIGWSPVLSVDVAETPEFVYDLVCDAPHTFLANGLFTHNCILWLDELEKGFAGTQSSPFSDGGTTSRVFGSFITWLQEKQAPCFVVATSNDVSQLPPEMMRKGRFDEIFFVDLPAAPERREIFSIHLKKRRRDPATFDLEAVGDLTVGYSGAEIEQVVVSALFKAFNHSGREVLTEDLLEVIHESVPLSVTMREGIQKLRDWAETRARPASSETAEDADTLAELELKAALREPSRRTGRQSSSASFGSGSDMAQYTMDTDDDPESVMANHEARLDALERKTGTGLDAVMHETQNLGGRGPRMPIVEQQGTSEPHVEEPAADPAAGDPPAS